MQSICSWTRTHTLQFLKLPLINLLSKIKTTGYGERAKHIFSSFTELATQKWISTLPWDDIISEALESQCIINPNRLSFSFFFLPQSEDKCLDLNCLNYRQESIKVTWLNISDITVWHVRHIFATKLNF